MWIALAILCELFLRGLARLGDACDESDEAVTISVRRNG
jgi:hypothetical protein